MKTLYVEHDSLPQPLRDRVEDIAARRGIALKWNITVLDLLGRSRTASDQEDDCN